MHTHSASILVLSYTLSESSVYATAIGYSNAKRVDNSLCFWNSASDGPIRTVWLTFPLSSPPTCPSPPTSSPPSSSSPCNHGGVAPVWILPRLADCLDWTGLASGGQLAHEAAAGNTDPGLKGNEAFIWQCGCFTARLWLTLLMCSHSSAKRQVG